MKWSSHTLVSIVALSVGTLLAAGCAGALGMTGSTEQLRELAADKNASCVRIDLMTPWGSQRTTSINVDKGITLARGGSAVIRGESCDTSISHAGPAPAGIEVDGECRITSTRSSLAEILRLTGELAHCAR